MTSLIAGTRIEHIFARKSYACVMALAGLCAQTILFGVQPVEPIRVGWVVLAVIVVLWLSPSSGSLGEGSGQDSSSGDPAIWSLALQE